MEDVNKLMHMAFATIVFCIGLLVLLYEAKTYNTTLSAVRGMFKVDVVYMQSNTTNEEIVSYAELIATLMRPLEYDIMVGGNQINKSTHTADKIPSYGIIVSNYNKGYQYNDSGSVEMIIYTRIR